MKSEPLHKTAPQLHPPTVPGRTCLQRAFPGSWQTASGIARQLGYEITGAAGGHHWEYVPHEAIGEINATLARWAAETQSAQTVTREHVSCRVLDVFLRFSALHFAQQLGIPMKQGPGAEPFIRIEDLPLVIAAARASPQGARWETGPDQPGRMIDWIETKGLAGLTLGTARRERRIPGGF